MRRTVLIWCRLRRLNRQWLIIMGMVVALYAATPLTAIDVSLQGLKQTMERIIPPGPQGRIAFCVTDLATGQSIGVNESTAMNPASVIKIPVMVETYAQERKGRFKLSDKIVLKKSQKVWGAGPLYSQPEGRAFSIQYIVECMIHYSDNTATKMLIDYLGKENINHTMRQIGLQKTVIGNSDLLKAEGLNYSSPRDMTLLLSKLSKGQVVSAKASREMLLILSQQKYRWGIPKPVPSDVLVANKTGTLNGIKHDCGVVLMKDSPYAISVFTSGFPSSYKAMGIISSLSDTVFKWAMSKSAS
jgi:beta-lactamase class A